MVIVSKIDDVVNELLWCVSHISWGAEMLEELGVRGRDLGERRGAFYMQNIGGFSIGPSINQVHGEKI